MKKTKQCPVLIGEGMFSFSYGKFGVPTTFVFIKSALKIYNDPTMYYLETKKRRI